ncbi:hypothetical protein HQ447_17020 [bacterium]|nr:hypothetical protein [bacterium]
MPSKKKAVKSEIASNAESWSETAIASFKKSKYLSDMPDVLDAIVTILENSPSTRFVEVAFAGSGDDGAIDEVNLFDEDKAPIRYSFDMDPNDFYDITEKEVSVDWGGGSGGGGLISINLIDMTIHVESHYYESEACDDKKLQLAE